jgi:hypothetical protein
VDLPRQAAWFQEQRRGFWGQLGFYNLVFESLGKKYRKCMPQFSRLKKVAVFEFFEAH